MIVQTFKYFFVSLVHFHVNSVLNKPRFLNLSIVYFLLFKGLELNNILVISWQSVLLVEEAEVPGENQ
jgi:hypothetical protein